MMLFDVVRKLNERIAYLLKERTPANRFGMITGTTDGTTVLIHFADEVVWDSTTWNYDNNYPSGMSEDQKIQAETKRIEDHIKASIDSHLAKLYDIQW